MTHPTPPLPPSSQEHNYLYALPAVALIGALAASYYTGVAISLVSSGVYLVSSALCIASIGCLSHQASARTGETYIL